MEGIFLCTDVSPLLQHIFTLPVLIVLFTICLKGLEIIEN